VLIAGGFLVLITVGLLGAYFSTRKGHEMVRALCERHGWRYERVGIEYFRIHGRDSGIDWTLEYVANRTSEDSRDFAFAYALPGAPGSILMPRSTYRAVTTGLLGRVTKSLNRMANLKIDLLMEGPEAVAGWSGDPRLESRYVLLGDIGIARELLSPSVVSALIARPEQRMPTVSVAQGKVRVTQTAWQHRQAIEDLPAMLEVGRGTILGRRF